MVPTLHASVGVDSVEGSYAYGTSANGTVNKPACPKHALAWMCEHGITGRVLTGSIEIDGVVRTSTSEVKFLDRGKTNFCESIRQECLH